ncbi:MAG: aldo/keto reductase [Candidatus Heimdallarchaeota archaeon]|nr:aldo/keto reductase [Candidatus Heimdallarchaeota archaeon]
MHYRTLGKTGRKVSVLGFGCMRLPLLDENDPSSIDEKEAIKIIRKGIDAGINYVDTAYPYHRGKSEVVLGKALKDGYREKVTLVTKNPVRMVEKPEDYDKFLKEQLERLDVDFIDVYLFHGLREERFEKVLEFDLIDRAKKAKEEGKIKHLGFSVHDKPENIKKFLDTNEFEVMLIQYNILDQVNEEVIKYAAEKGVGVVIMGPVAGGRLALPPPEEMKEWVTPGRNDFVDLALKFVWSNPNVSVALSGMGSETMVDENLSLASKEPYTLTEAEKERAESIGKTYRELSDLICTQCGYCMPCEQEVNITHIMKQLIHWQVLKWDQAKRYYRMIGKTPIFKGKDATGCIECGDCEEKCPQNIPIIERLKEAHSLLAEEAE